MKNNRIISALVVSVTLLAEIAASPGIFCGGGSGSYEFQSICGKTVTIYDKVNTGLASNVCI